MRFFDPFQKSKVIWSTSTTGLEPVLTTLILQIENHKKYCLIMQ